MFNYLKLIKLILNKNAEKSAAQELSAKNLTVSVAESCTGGLISSLLTDVSGSSSFIKINFVTYSNEAKTKYLKVREETLSEFGAVSMQTADEMVKGLLDETGCDIALATTGVAGPTGGSQEKPVGLVYIGVGCKDRIEVVKYNVNPKFPRVLVKYMFAKKALKVLKNFIKECN